MKDKAATKQGKSEETTEKKKSKKDKKPTEVNFNPDSSKGDLDNFNTKAKKLIKTGGDEDQGGEASTSNTGFMKNLFVTEDDNAVME